jgi:hypothetical protein
MPPAEALVLAVAVLVVAVIGLGVRLYSRSRLVDELTDPDVQRAEWSDELDVFLIADDLGVVRGFRR